MQEKISDNPGVIAFPPALYAFTWSLVLKSVIILFAVFLQRSREV